MLIPDGWHIEYNPKPIPAWVGCDWDYWHDNHDGENGLCGTAGSESDAVEACIAMQYEIDAIADARTDK